MSHVHLLQTSSRPRLGVLVVQSFLTSKPGSRNMVSSRCCSIHTPKSTKTDKHISERLAKSLYVGPRCSAPSVWRHDMQQCNGVTSSHQVRYLIDLINGDL